jgi:putative hemolysin
MSGERNGLAVLFLIVGVTITGCSRETAVDEQPAATALANPAAVFCVEDGGTYAIRRAADGSQTGVCILEDGAEVDAWAHFRDKAAPN